MKFANKNKCESHKPIIGSNMGANARDPTIRIMPIRKEIVAESDKIFNHTLRPPLSHFQNPGFLFMVLTTQF